MSFKLALMHHTAAVMQASLKSEMSGSRLDYVLLFIWRMKGSPTIFDKMVKIEKSSHRLHTAIGAVTAAKWVRRSAMRSGSAKQCFVGERITT